MSGANEGTSASSRKLPANLKPVEFVRMCVIADKYGGVFVSVWPGTIADKDVTGPPLYRFRPTRTAMGPFCHAIPASKPAASSAASSSSTGK